ncbi:hypothetical protein SLE2022_279480 [Rubroshorea leprosula]
MEDSEKTMALKKAYAEIILNTAKEAAVRVMVSEKKASRFQQDLSATKDEAVRLLVRWKQMMDAKTTEAEKTSLNQQKKIDELEAQLHEAEDIITDLRTELRYVQDKLEKVKKNEMQPLNVQITAEDESPQIDSMPVPITHSPFNLGFVATTNSDLRNDTLDQKYLDDKCCNALKQDEQSDISPLESHFAHNSDITTMLMRGKEPDLYKNGCTQRIRALERKFLDERLLPPGGVEDPHSVLENELIVETSAGHDEKCLISSPKSKSMRTANFSRDEVKKPVKSCISRRRKTRFGRAKSTSRKSRAGQLIKPSPSSVLSHSRRYPSNRSVKSDECLQTVSSIKDDNMDVSGSEEELEHKSNCCTDESELIQNGKGCLKLESRDTIATSFKSHLCQFDETCCKTSTNSVSFNVNSGGNQLRIANNEAKIKPLPHLDPGLTLFKSDMDPISWSKNITMSSVKALNKCGLVQNIADKGMKLRDEPMLDMPEADARVISKLPSSELSSDLIGVPLTYSNLKDTKASEETDASPIKVANDRLLKYTFQRKRKKESFSDSDEKTSAENISLKKRAGERQKNAQETEKPSLMNEMTRDSRRMAQVARQLISLSGKRWS